MTYRFEKASILVVDDMLPMLSLVASLLRIFGFKDVYTAHDAEEGFEQFCAHTPDVVLTDWMMGETDGNQLIHKIRQEPLSPNRFVPIIMMSGYSHRAKVEMSRDNGVTEFLVKPFTANDLYSRLEKIIEKPRQFVDADEFFGPDRRRKKPASYQGPFRRDEELASDSDKAENKESAELLRNLRRDTIEKIGK